MRRLLLIAVALAVALSLLAGTHFYLATRLVLEPALPEPLRGAALALLGGLALLLVAEPIAERAVGPPWSRIVTWPAALWMGFLFLLLVALGLSDLLMWLLGAASSDPTGGSLARGRAAFVGAGVAVAGALALRSGLRPPAVRRVELALDRWPRALDGLRLVQISDIHVGPLLGRRFASDLVARVNALAPDLVVVTGDLVDGRVAHLEREVAPFAELRGRLGVYFVTGNHDHYSGAVEWVAAVERLGMRALRNARVTLGEGDARFDLAGVDDHRGDLYGREGGEDLDRALAGRDPERPVVLLAHDPTTWKAASRRGVDLQLSGHTHGGQIWPFMYVVRLAVPFVAGVYQRGGSTLYVSRGSGFWGPPMRLAAPAEITEIVLRARDGTGGAQPGDLT
jgi:hypothetical protein